MSHTLFDTIEMEREDVGMVIKTLSTTCESCRLSLAHPYNRGVIYRGNPFAAIAVIHESPRDSETERGVAMIGSHGKEFERWMDLLKLDTRKDVFITSVIQCQPPKELRNGKHSQREPEEAEVSACFGPRCLRILRAMPNLEVVITLGWTAAKAFLGGKPIPKTHESQWFESSLIPGVAIFCMVDPVWVIGGGPSPEKSRAVERSLEHFKREYLTERKVLELATEAKQRREEQGLGLL